MKTTKKKIRLTLLLLCCLCFVFIHCNQKKSTLIDPETQKAIDAEVANFKYLCHLNELRADSFAQVVNENYNYPYHFTARFKTERKGSDRLLLYDVPYYGMTDGYKGFVFSLHRMKVKEISVHWGGFDNFWAFYDWDLFGDDDECWGWDMSLHTLEIKIPEHEKVIKDFKERAAKTEKENKSRRSLTKIYFSDLGFYLVY